MKEPGTPIHIIWARLFKQQGSVERLWAEPGVAWLVVVLVEAGSVGVREEAYLVVGQEVAGPSQACSFVASSILLVSASEVMIPLA